MMAKILMLLLGMCVVSSGWSPVWGGPIPVPLQGVTLSARVSRDNSTALFTYQYRVTNPAINDGQIRQLTVEISRMEDDAVLSQEGLLNGPRYAQHSSENAVQRVPMVPVGIDGPEGWLYGLGFDPSPRGFATWGSFGEQFRILPDQALEGFRLTSYGLPGIRMAQIQPGIDYDNLPDEFSDPDKARELRDSLIFYTMTVGPKAPPQNFIANEFLDYLITLLNESREWGWIKVDGVHQSLLAKLTSAKRKLEAGESKVAKNMLNAFLNEVEATACQQFTCPGNKPLTSEAYALLFFNGRYLWGRL